MRSTREKRKGQHAPAIRVQQWLSKTQSLTRLSSEINAIKGNGCEPSGSRSLPFTVLFRATARSFAQTLAFNHVAGGYIWDQRLCFIKPKSNQINIIRIQAWYTLSLSSTYLCTLVFAPRFATVRLEKTKYGRKGFRHTITKQRAW